MTCWIVFTDLDGTLLDRHSYAWSAAAEAVDWLKQRSIPIVFCSSKTRAEQVYYQSEMKLRHPAIVENGSAILVPRNYFPPASMPEHHSVRDEWVIELGVAASVIQTTLDRIQHLQGLNFRRYARMEDLELAELTGLRGAALDRARQREYSETIEAQFDQGQWSTFQQALAEEGLHCVSGGHLRTVTSKLSDKGRAAKILMDLYRQTSGEIRTVGLGDSPNDRPLLEQMDIAFLIQRPDSSWCEMDLPGLRRVGIGPRGWKEAIAALSEGDGMK